MRRNWIMSGLFVALLLFGFSSVASAASEQVIFSGVGFGTFDETPTPVGFWIWCQAENPSSHQDYVGECAGAMYFYVLGITKAVEGEIEESETEEGVYTMTVGSRKGSSIIGCQLTNHLPITQGPSNTVDIVCATPSGNDGLSTNAVVNVTGPPED
ncbi:MAG TPA: hypothetical protein VF999_09495 [Thermoanaerobaculia bacterium]